MPVILSQHYLPSDRVYRDVEFSLYHYPRVYFSRINPYDTFIYYRPLGESVARPDSKHYFGHGVLGRYFDDPHDATHRYVPLIQAEAFEILVPLVDSRGRYYETEHERGPQFVSAVRTISPTAYFKILAAADRSAIGISHLPSTETVLSYDLPAAAAPFDPLRIITEIPAGAGYVPHGDTTVNVFESAALQERARADHQTVLQTVQREILRRGGSTWYNNNIDLFGRIGENKYLIEAKSLNDVRESVNRMRYGIGQLADYAFRYKSVVGNAQKVLAFGQRPAREAAWIGDVLDDAAIALVSAEPGIQGVTALNATARSIGWIA